MGKGLRIVAGLGIVLAPALASAQSGSVVNLSARTDVMRAGGNASGSDGLVPTAIALDAGLARALRVTNVTGSVGCAGGTGFNADGVDGSNAPCVNSAVITSAGTISGITLNGRSIGLVGVFLDADRANALPGALTYGGAGLSYTAPTFGPFAVGQTFFIGDGLTGIGSGTVQSFLVPDDAAFLYFGFVDAFGYQGPPAAFGDNVGSLSFNFNVAPTSTVPEPSTYALMATGLVAVAGIARRRARG